MMSLINDEETYHAEYIQAAAREAGLQSRIIKGVAGLGWNDAGDIVDAEGTPITESMEVAYLPGSCG